MLVTPSQRAFADAHQARRRAFFPSSRPKRLPPAETPLAGKGSGTTADAIFIQPVFIWRKPKIKTLAVLVGKPAEAEVLDLVAEIEASMISGDLRRRNSQAARITRIADIIAAVCRHYAVSEDDLLSHRRTKSVAMPRHVACYLARTLTRHSLPEIGRRMGGRDHTTIRNSWLKLLALVPSSPELAADIEAIKAMLRPAA